jgi:hypothetical protein
MKQGVPAGSDFSLIEPMKALSVPDLPAGRWLYEVKFDGYRALAFKNGKETRLLSRNQKAFNYPELLDALKLLPARNILSSIARSPLWIRRAGLLSNFCKLTRSVSNAHCRCITLSIRSPWKEPICASSRSSNGGPWPLKRLVVLTAFRMSWSNSIACSSSTSTL